MPTAYLNWTDPNFGALQEDEVRVYRALEPFDADSLPAVLATLPADTLAYEDPTVLAATTYWYAVAFEKDGSLAIRFTGKVGNGFSAADAYVVSASGPDLDAHQGIITQAGGWVLVFNNALRRYNSNWVLQATNANPIGDMGFTPGVVNMIDMFEYDSKLWTVRGFNIFSFNATTMAFLSSHAFTAGPSFVGFSAVSAGPVAGYLYGVQQFATVIEVHNLATGAWVEDISIGGTLSECNGLHFLDGWFYFAERPNTLRRCRATGGGLETVLQIGSFEGMDGLSGGADFLDLLMDNTWDGVLRITPFTGSVTQTTGEGSGEIVVNGDGETANMNGWLNWNNLITNVFSAALGAKPDSRTFRGATGGFMIQTYLIPQRAWNSIDAGNGRVNLSWQQVGTSNASCAITLFDDHFTALSQLFRNFSAPGAGAWVTRTNTNGVIPAGTRMVMVLVELSGLNAQIDNITASVTW